MTHKINIPVDSSDPVGNLVKGVISLSEYNTLDVLTHRFLDESRVAKSFCPRNTTIVLQKGTFLSLKVI